MPDDLNVMKCFVPQVDRPACGTEAYEKMSAYRGRFDRHGYVHVSGPDMQTLTGHTDNRPLLEVANDMPLDPYGGGQRRRLYRTAMFYPWAGELRFDPVFRGPGGSYVPYFQDQSLNGDQGGHERRFCPVPDRLETDQLLRRLISILYHLIPKGLIESRLPIRTGIHFIRLSSDGREACVPSPNTVHVDGEPFTAIVLIDRVNVTKHSAGNIIAKRHCAGLQAQDIAEDDRLYEATLTEPLEFIYCDDARVAHGVSSVLGAGESNGWRTSLLVDFSDIRLVRTGPPRKPLVV